MKRILLVLVLILGCSGQDDTDSYLDAFYAHLYYAEEIFEGVETRLYGTWRLYDISGGFSGMGHQSTYDLLTIKPVGIYGIIRNEEPVEQGKIERITFDVSNPGILQVKFVPEQVTGLSSLVSPLENYMELQGKDTLHLNAPCCDRYNYHFKRIN